MAGFDEREKGQEAKFAHDSEMAFKAEARRNKLLGLWAAEQLGIEEEADRLAYAAEVVAADFSEVGEDDVVRKISGDFSAKGVSVGEDAIRAKLAELMSVAREQVLKEG